MSGNCGECDRRGYCVIDPEKCDNLSEPALTNADKIRAMSDEELAEFLSVGVVAVFVCDLCEIVGVTRAECNVNSCRKAVLKWLHWPAEVDE